MTLEALRKRKLGLARAQDYDSQDEHDTTFSRNAEDTFDEDFVVDDDGQGYVESNYDAPMDLKPANNSARNFFKRQKPHATPVRPKEGLADDLIAGLSSSSRKRAPITPPNIDLKPKRDLRRPMLPTFEPQSEPASESTPEAPIEAVAEPVPDSVPGPVLAPEPVSDVVSDTSAIIRQATPETPHHWQWKKELPSSPITHKENSSLPTPNHSSDHDWEDYAQNIVEYSSETPQIGSVLTSNDVVEFFYNDYSLTSTSVMLFGRATNGSSVCVIVEGLYRELYFLPTQGCTAQQVMSEVVPMVSRHTVAMPVKANIVKKKYCFGIRGIPREAEYCQIRVPFKVSLPEFKGHTFSHVFGARSTLFERFALINNVKGPCWLKANSIRTLPQGTSTCAITASVQCENLELVPSPKDPMPKMTLMSLSLRTLFNTKTKKQEIVAISVRVFRNVAHDTVVTADKLNCEVVTGVRPIDTWPLKFKTLVAEEKLKSIYTHTSETSLLNWFMTKVRFFDPDVIVGHSLENIHFGILFNRLRDLKISNWHFMGRRGANTVMPNRTDKHALRDWLPGRLVCDINNEMGKSMTTNCDSWTLSEMCDRYLGVKRPEIDFDIEKSKLDLNDPNNLIRVLRYNEQDTMLAVSLALKIQILALSKVLTNLSGNSWYKTLEGSRADRNEYILLHEFTAQNYIVPDKQPYGSGGGITKGNKYEGGKVFDPEKGLYRSMVLVMDFNSLYPSLIQEFNICFTTVDIASFDGETLPELPASNVAMGIFPRLVQSLVERRREVKRAMKRAGISEAERAQFDIRQTALKLTANSMYGCLGFSQSRFYALPLASLTTTKGREVLQSTRMLAEKNNLQVIYGDTDSVMINTGVYDYQKALEIGGQFKKQVNGCYKLLEIDIDNVFGSMLLNAKKKYAALNLAMKEGQLVSKMEVKGLDLKRREFCELSKDISNFTLNLIFERDDIGEAAAELYEYLKKMAADINEDRIKLPKYVIRKKLGKEPSKYSEADAKNLDHVALARRRLAQGELVRQDDIMAYVIVQGDEPHAERAKTLADLHAHKLEIDKHFYLTTQIFPAVERICANIEAIDRITIGEALGISKVVKRDPIFNPLPAVTFQSFETSMPASERFKNCDPLEFRCQCDSHKFVFRGIEDLGPRGIECASCSYVVEGFMLNTQLQQQIAAKIAKYYEFQTVCGECKTVTKRQNVMGRNCLQRGGRCVGKVQHTYNSRELYAQLSYYKYMLDMARVPENDEQRVLMAKNSGRFDHACNIIDRFLDSNGRRVVNMKSLFSI